jgi:L-2-hydroxyglutarate oxidase
VRHSKKYDIVIIGAGIIGLASARALLVRSPKLKVLILEKENTIGVHASGRNSGVLHAGFYYSPDSLKAKFCREGNSQLLKLAESHGIKVKNTGKVVVARNESESQVLSELYKRGKQNGVELKLLQEKDLEHFEPLARTVGQFLWSPNTSVADKSEINNALLIEVQKLGAEIVFNANCFFENNHLILSGQLIRFGHLVNCSGAYSLRLAKKMGFGKKYQMIPFLGAYMAVPTSKLDLRTLVYPVPDPINPFLGTHFTITSDGYTKIGPTALPVFCGEQYTIFQGWNLYDARESMRAMSRFAVSNPKICRDLLIREVKRLRIPGLIDSASLLVPKSSQVSGWERKPAGIRAQLLELESNTLEQDFVVEGDQNSTHILNAVSPGWTSSLAFADWVAVNFILQNF